MKKRVICLFLLVCLGLSGCTSLLGREYASVTLHSAAPAAEEDSSALRVESYQELVNALLYLVTQGAQSGLIRLYNYAPGKVNEDMEAACLEVNKEDPLGAYSVDYISFEVSTIVSYFEANISIQYKRSREQVAAIVAATGSSAIRSQLQRALTDFSDEVVLRIGYFDGDEAYIRTLLQEAYYTTPASALDLPDAQIFTYPAQGTRKIVEVLLTYHLDKEVLRAQQSELERKAESLPLAFLPTVGSEQLLSIMQMVLESAAFDPAAGDTAHSALVEGRADSRGLALALALMCQKLDIFCQVVEGTQEEKLHFWNILFTPSGYRHVDLTRLEPEEMAELRATDQLPEGVFFSDRELLQQGYNWNRQSTPLCGAQPE